MRFPALTYSDKWYHPTCDKWAYLVPKQPKLSIELLSVPVGGVALVVYLAPAPPPQLASMAWSLENQQALEGVGQLGFVM